MSITRLTTIGAFATLVSCNLNHPALEPPVYPESASVNLNGTDYLVEELENPTPAYTVTTPPPSVVLPSVPETPEPAPVVAATELPPPSVENQLAAPLAEPEPAAELPQQPEKPKIATSTPSPSEAEPPPAPEPVDNPTPAPELASTPTPTPPPAPEKEPAPAPVPAKPAPAAVAAVVEPEPADDTEADTLRAEEFAFQFAKMLPFPSDTEIAGFPQVISPETLTQSETRQDTAKTTVLLDKVRKNLARARAANRAPAPWANQPATAAKIPTPIPADAAGESFDSSIESLSIMPGAPHDERLDFGLDLGPSTKFNFGDTPD